MAEAASLRVFIGLVVVIGAILLCGWLARRTGLAGRAPGGKMRIVDSLNLGPRQRIVLIEVEDSWLLVGVTAGQMTVLHTLPAGEATAPRPPGSLAASLAAFGRPRPKNTLSGSEPTRPEERDGASFANKLGQALRRG